MQGTQEINALPKEEKSQKSQEEISLEPKRKRRKPRQIWDWESLKFDFLESSALTVQEFLRKREIPWNGNVALRTTGWAKEKKELSKKIVTAVQDRTQEKIEQVAEERSNSIASEIVEVLKRQESIADLLLQRVEEMAKDNRQVYGVIKGRKIIGKLNPSNILSLSKAAASASELQRIAKGIDKNEPGSDSDGRELVQQGILDRIRSNRESRGAD